MACHCSRGSIPAQSHHAPEAPWGFAVPAKPASVPDTVGYYYEQMGGVATLDYEDMLLMLYALRFDVPNVQVRSI